MKFGEYEVTLSPLGWLALAAAAASAAAPGSKSRGQDKSMAYKLTVFIVNPDDEQIYVEHNFYGETRSDAEHVKREHLGSCEYFRAAEQEGRTIEDGEEIDSSDWPEVEDLDVDDADEDVNDD